MLIGKSQIAGCVYKGMFISHLISDISALNLTIKTAPFTSVQSLGCSSDRENKVTRVAHLTESKITRVAHLTESKVTRVAHLTESTVKRVAHLTV